MRIQLILTDHVDRNAATLLLKHVLPSATYQLPNALAYYIPPHYKLRPFRQSLEANARVCFDHEACRLSVLSGTVSRNLSVPKQKPFSSQTETSSTGDQPNSMLRCCWSSTCIPRIHSGWTSLRPRAYSRTRLHTCDQTRQGKSPERHDSLQLSLLCALSALWHDLVITLYTTRQC